MRALYRLRSQEVATGDWAEGWVGAIVGIVVRQVLPSRAFLLTMFSRSFRLSAWKVRCSKD